MIPPTFQIGDEVLITGPPCGISGYRSGVKGTITNIGNNGNCCVGGWWYPASSLQLVEPELKIGDWAEVVESPKYFPQYPAKTIFCITKGPLECKGILGFGGIRNCVDCYCGEGTPFYEANSLRKLTPEEIKQHTAPTKEDLDQIEEKFKMDRRLSAIEKRLDFVENFQRGQAEAAQYRRNMYRR